MQKKNDETFGFMLLVIIVFNAVNDPIKYAPLSPKKILALGKLNNKKDKRIIICEVIIKVNSKFAPLRLIYAKIIFIIIKFKDNKPLKPSIKFAPLITNKKHKRTKIEENKWFFVIVSNIGISIFKI